MFGMYPIGRVNEWTMLGAFIGAGFSMITARARARNPTPNARVLLADGQQLLGRNPNGGNGLTSSSLVSRMTILIFMSPLWSPIATMTAIICNCAWPDRGKLPNSI
jgi:hypothetical protein